MIKALQKPCLYGIVITVKIRAASELENAPRFLILEERTRTWLIA